MLDKNQIAAASETLRDHWRAGTKLRGLEASLRPRDRAEGYAIQGRIENYSDGRLFGWKIAATSEAGQKHINVDGPMAGRILPEPVIPDGGPASMAGNAMRVAEPEFAFRMHADLPPRLSPYTVREVLDAVDTLHPAIEIPDSRFADFVEEKPVITLRGQRFTGHGKNVLGDPLIALTWLANELRQLGVTLRAGQVVTTGTCPPPLPIQSGEVFDADFGLIGRVSVEFE